MQLGFPRGSMYPKIDTWDLGNSNYGIGLG